MSISFDSFFSDATGYLPYRWQASVATEGIPEILSVPTGLGKTEGAVLAWAFRRLVQKDAQEPRHLVYCLPMRTLVRQTVERLQRCFENLENKHSLTVGVYQLMGGAVENEWARWPDRPWVLVGTQDQLLSRALNRGYAMSRFEWPMHFGLLNQDCHWIIDEVQLMGPGLWTTAQLDWMRRKRFASIAPCRTTWMSATVGAGFLATTDRKRDGFDVATPFDTELDTDRNVELQRRRAAKRPVNWFRPKAKRDAPPLHNQLACAIADQHVKGTLSLVVCNTVEMARGVFLALPDSYPKILLTSRFRRQDREAHEKQLLDFEERRRKSGGNPTPDNPGLICVSTQVVEAGVDVSAHRLWSELAPWPSIIQRLGRLNRDGRDQDAHAWFWETQKGGGLSKNKRIGPYEPEDIEQSKKLIEALAPLSQQSFAQAVHDLTEQHEKDIEKTLQPKQEIMPRALDVHGLFATERDVHGGFTDVSAFVRGTDPGADLTVVWRDWGKGEKGVRPPSGDDLDGPPLDMNDEGCPISFFRLADFIKARKARAWIWNDEDTRWDLVRADGLRPGMVVMLHSTVGGYDVRLGWTADTTHKLDSVPRAGCGRALRDDRRTEAGQWTRLDVHLGDARKEAETLCDMLGIRDDHPTFPRLRTAVVEAAARHDIGKAYPQWQDALPAVSALTGGPWAKCPRVIAVDANSDSRAIREAVHKLRADTVFLGIEPQRRGRKELVRLCWAVGQKLTRDELDALRCLKGVQWVGHSAFRPGLRHEAASALAMWHRYREGNASYPALSVYLAAAHHGKVRSVLRSTTISGDDVFGVPRDPDVFEAAGVSWPLDFTVAKDGAEGKWKDGSFILTGYGWTGLVADLLGPWRPDDSSRVGAVPDVEPRKLGPFVLAYLEALVRVADWRASERPSKSTKPAEVRHDR